ncbi:MAG: DUF305 domain-containing protein [Devosia sp.]
MKSLLLAATLTLAFGLPVLAQDKAPMAPMAGMTATDTDAPATRAYEAANMQMHEDMAVQYTGDADVDFVKSMIPHHQGAVDMARIVLQYGKDPQVKALAEGVIKAQESEIAWMQDWLAKQGL